MGQSTGRQLHVDQVLTQMAMGYKPAGLIADVIAPIITVGKQSDYYLVYDRAGMLRIENTRRAPGTEAHKITRQVSSGTYFANNWALKDNVTIEDKANADPAFVQALFNDRAQFLLDKLGLDWENRIAAQVTATANVGSSSGVGSEWDAGNGDVIGDIQTAMDNVQDLTGYRPNRCVMGLAAWRSARRSTDILNRLFGTNNGGGYPNTSQVANLLELEQIVVGGAYKNTANESQAESLSTVWGDDVLVYYAPPNPSRDRPSFMYSMRWAGNGLANLSVERHPFDNKKKTEEVEVGYYQDEVITGSQYGYLLKAVNSST